MTAATDTPATSESDEIPQFLESIFRHTGYDLRDYALGSMRRRIRSRIKAENTPTVAALLEKALGDSACLERLLHALLVAATSMFRDPDFFLTFRREVVPLLKTYPFVRIWHAGCSSGEEVYSLAILLDQEGLLERCLTYATDISESALRQAREGTVPLAAMKEYTQNYQEAGGEVSFSKYYTACYDRAIFRPYLRKNVVFARHNLVTDGPFNEFNVILCRNVMIYFNQSLQQRVHDLLYRSLAQWGVLGLGKKESLRFTPHEACYETVDADVRLYRKVT